LNVEALKRIFEDYKSQCDFVTIYIREAHALDEWRQGDAVQIRQHRTLEERIGVARQFVKDYQWTLPTVVDSMENTANTTFAIWPERYVLVDAKGVISYIQQRQDDFMGYEGRQEAELATLRSEIDRLIPLDEITI
jgi:hypothetical protein